MVPKLSQCIPKMVPKGSQNGPKMVPKWSQNGPKIVPKWPYNDPIMSERSMRSFRHLKHQNLSTGDDFINSSRKKFQFYFWPPRRHQRHLQVILTCREDCLEILNVKINLLQKRIITTPYIVMDGTEGMIGGEDTLNPYQYFSNKLMGQCCMG